MHEKNIFIKKNPYADVNENTLYNPLLNLHRIDITNPFPRRPGLSKKCFRICFDNLIYFSIPTATLLMRTSKYLSSPHNIKGTASEY